MDGVGLELTVVSGNRLVAVAEVATIGRCWDARVVVVVVTGNASVGGGSDSDSFANHDFRAPKNT